VKIYTIGYDHLKSVGELAAILLWLRISHLIDVRSKPYGHPRWSKPVLTKLFGKQYFWMGDTLGAFTPISKRAIRLLAEESASRPMLMCKEDSPGNCHRHHAIAVPLLALGIDCIHVFEDKTLLASELQASVVEGRLPVLRPL
jgi:uncharacterized protein (DUF488 family)